MRGRVLALLAAATVASAACSSATGEHRGGEPTFDAATACFVDPGNPGERDAGSGTRWPDLYRDLFGPTSPASCAGTGNSCHGVPDVGGAAAGFLCRDSIECAETLRSFALPSPPASNPDEGRLLHQILRRRDADGCVTGRMPQAPASYVFSETSLERIRTWIRDGAPTD
jgi:hypothetical protein